MEILGQISVEIDSDRFGWHVASPQPGAREASPSFPQHLVTAQNFAGISAGISKTELILSLIIQARAPVFRIPLAHQQNQ
jgi:hypothetical protein